jgi:hypothetical protein
MKKDQSSNVALKKKLVLRKESIRALDDADLSQALGGGEYPPDGGVPPNEKTK